MEIQVQSGNLTQIEGPVCLIGYYEGEGAKGAAGVMDRALGGKVRKIAASEGFTGKFLQTLMIRSDGAIGFERLILVGLGKRAEITEDRLRQSAGKGAAAVQKMGLGTISVHCDVKALGKGSAKGLSQALVEGVILSLYECDRLKTNKKKNKKLKTCTLVVDHERDASAAESGGQRGRVIAEGVCFARDLCSLPSNVVTPTYLAKEAAKIAESEQISLEVLEQEEIQSMGMGAFHAVTQGSETPPRFIVLQYQGAPQGKRKRPVALIGKSVTFDTGGISLKPSENMEQMKYDMSGGAVVLGVMNIIARLRPPINLVAVLPATDNMPSGKAVHPGDVVTSLSGKSVEIVNTDAEGRLCLADALSYATRFKPAAMIDLATLTGACVVALGQHAMGMMGNNSRLLSKVQAAGAAVGERTWELPLWDDYFNQIESDVADLQNVGGRAAGTITAGLFLKQFVNEIPWVHLDIAGTSWYNNAKHAYVPKGATGVGVRLLVQFLTSEANGRKR
ncbi:MAG: leucyl aminopeptidase [Nitrospiria bacterium]